MKKATRYFIYSFLLVLCMIVSIGTFNVYAIDEVPITKWTDYAASSFAGGDGSKNNPYQIATAEQLAKLAREVNLGIPSETHSGEYFKLVAPIDLSGKKWVPIGYGNMNSHPFSGYFDGNNQTITGLYVDERENNVCAGLFGVVVATSNETVLKNFQIENAEIYAGNGTNSSSYPDIYGGGILVGELTIMGGSNVTFVGVENCHVTGSVDSIMYAGGLIGSASYAHVSNCSADVAIKGVSTSGGFVAYAFLSSFKDCMAKGDVQGGWYTGGFAGFISNDSTNNAEINHCVAYGNINACDWNAGGFVGSLENGRITNSLSYGDVTSTVVEWKPKVGGFAGSNTNGVIKDSIAAGKVTSLHSSIEPGGFIGYNDGSTENCAFDNIKNSLLNGIGEGNSTDSNGIKAENTESLIFDICMNYYGGHDFSGEYVIDKQPTCVKEGSKSKHCSRCDVSGESQVISKVDHEWDSEYRVDHEATCIEDGVKSIHCKNCDAKKDEVVIKATGHTLEWIVDKEATQTQNGSKHQVCTKGDYVGESVKIPATGSEQSSQRIFKILDGDKEIYEKTSKKTLSIEIDHDFTENVRVEVDGKQIGKDKYKLTKGSTIVTLTNEYLESLSIGKHTINTYFEDGKATATFTVKEKEQPIIITTSKEEIKETENKTVSKKVNTGDNTNVMNILGLFVLSVFGCVSLRKRV